MGTMHIRFRPENGDGPHIFRILHCQAVAVLALAFLLMPVPRADAIDVTGELSVGYDSNPALGDPAEGSGFSTYGAGLGHAFKWSEHLMLDAYVEGKYQDYWQLEDNYRVQAGTTLNYSMADGRILTSLMGEAGAYRDHLIEADERNEVMVGLGVEWILTSRLTIGLAQTCRFLSYLNWARPFSGKGQGRGANREPTGGKHSSATTGAQMTAAPTNHGSGSGNRQLRQLYPPRDNRFLSTTLNLDIFILPSVTARVYAAYGDLNASLDMESYWELQTGFGIFWTPEAWWHLGFEARGSRVRYYSVPEDITRVRYNNNIWFMGLNVSRFWEDFEFFGELGWTAGEAPLDAVDYTQTVILCGISYAF